MKFLYASLSCFAHNYRYSIAVIAILLILWGVGARVVWVEMNKEIQNREASNQLEIEKTLKLSEEFKAKRLAENEAEAVRKANQVEEAAGSGLGEPKTNMNTNTVTNTTAGCNTANSHNIPASIDILVNKKHCLQPLTFTPTDLVTSNGATLSSKALNGFNQMFADAARDGQPFTVSSSYRSYGTQVSTYNYWVSVNGQQGADTVSARPGHSEHQTGLAVDIGANGCDLDCFGSTTQYQWFQANAANYGFIQRYYGGFEQITGYASEEWHYRYVGVSVAQDMKSKNVKTLEQYWGLEGGNYR